MRGLKGGVCLGLGILLLVSPVLLYDWHTRPTYRFTADKTELLNSPGSDEVVDRSELSHVAACAVGRTCGPTRTVFLHRPEHSRDIDRLRANNFVRAAFNASDGDTRPVFYDIQIRRSFFHAAPSPFPTSPPPSFYAVIAVPLGAWLLLFGFAQRGPRTVSHFSQSPITLTIVAWLAIIGVEVFTVRLGGRFTGLDFFPVRGVLVGSFALLAGGIGLIRRRHLIRNDD